jgi:hypothetical protein
VLGPFGFYSPKQDIAFASMLEKICELAAKRGLPVLLIGGHAVIAHGHPRNTFDIDFVIELKDQRAWRGLLEGLGYTLHAETRTFFQMQPSDEQTLPVDVMMVNEPTFAKMLALAKECSGLPPDARVVSLEHLLALKCHAIKHGHPGRVEKDVDDVLGLVSANQLDVTSSDWREIFLKYGTPELYEKLRKARQRPSP